MSADVLWTVAPVDEPDPDASEAEARWPKEVSGTPCRAQSPSAYWCSRPAGHGGEHRAWAPHYLCQVWTDDEGAPS